MAGEARGSGGFKAALAAEEDWGRTVKACLERLGDPPEGANLGFVYATDALAGDLGSILTFLRETTPVADWVGTVGLGVSGPGVEVYERPALSILVGALPPDSFRVFQSVVDDVSSLFAEHGTWIAGHEPPFGIVHGDPRHQGLAGLVSELSTETAAFLVGGLAASHQEFPQIAGRVTQGGLSGVLFDATVPVVTGLSQGCTPIGGAHRVTEAEENIIKSIDGRPALEVFKEDIGELLARDLRRVAGYIYAAFPIAGTDTGDYLVRNLMGIDVGRGWIAVGETVSEGQPLRFCRRDHDAAKQDLERMLADVTRRAGGAARGGIYVSCVARGHNLFGSDSEELKMVRASLGDVPLAGFFANGEISNNRLYGYTGVLTLFL